LVGLTADESIKILEAATATRPTIERAHWARFPDWHFMALAELRGRVAVELQDFRKRRGGVGAHRVLAGRARCKLGDRAHADRMVVAPAQHRLACGRAKRGGMEAVVLEPGRRKLLEVRGLARAAECRRRAKADIVDQDDHHIRRTLRRPQGLDLRELGIRVFGVKRRQSDGRAIRNGQDVALNFV
jgi:hypothetical protein